MTAPGTSVRDRLVVLVTAFVVSLGMVAGIATAVTGGDDPERALPETRDPVPVIAPVATGPTPPAEPDPATADGSGGGGTGGGTPSPDVSESAATDGGGGASSDAPGTAGGDGESDGSAGGAGEALPDFGLRFYDECAGTEPGGSPPEGCPEPSVGGTVLALTDPYPQYVLFAPHAGGTGWATRCPSGPLAEGELPGVAVTLNPGTMRLEYWPQADGAAGWSLPDDPSVVTTIDRTTASESDPEHRLWAGWFEDGTLGRDDKRVQYCLTLSDLLEDQSYGFRVSSTDIFGSSASYTGNFGLHAPATPRDRPPVTITPVDDTRVAVRVPIRSGSNEHAIVHAVPRSGPDAGTCADVEAGGLDAFGPPRGARGPTETTTDVSDDELEAEGYPWARTYDEVYEKQLSLEEGTTSAVCVWWQTGPRRSFDPSRITEREEHLITAPNRYRFRATIERLTFTRGVEVDGVEIDILRPGGSRLCTAAVPAEEVALGDAEQVVVEPRDVFCDLTTFGDTAAIGDALDVRVTGPVGTHLTSRIDLSARPCGPDGAVRVCTPERTDWYRLNIPGEVASRTLCGGVGDLECEPTRHRSAGMALLRVDLVDGPSAGSADGFVDFAAPAPFTGDDTVPEPPPYPQLDDFTSGVEPSDRDSLTVTANLDRPATVRAFVYAEPGDPTPCLLPGATGSVTSATMSPSHFLVFDGLCAAHLYSVALEMTDAEGDVAYAALSGWAVPRPVQRWNGWGTVRGFDANVDVYMQILDLPGHGYGYLTRAEVSFDGNEFSWPEPVGGCFARGDRRGSSFARTDDGVAWTFSNQVEIVVDVEAVEAFNWDDRDPLRPRCERRRNSGRTRLQATVPAEELLRGTPVTLTSPAGDLLEVEVEVVVTPRGA